MAPAWVHDATFYHIYPLGLCDAPRNNDFSSAPLPRLNQLYPWIDHILALNLNAVYFGPLFESTAHGYDTADYFQVDRRLGDHGTLKWLIRTMKERGLRVIFDGVFNHVGRDFWAFRDVLAHGRDSAYIGWFYGLDFNATSPYGDPFTYEGWAGHYDLVKLNLHHPDVRQHLFDAVSMWVNEFDIDGLRLDAADCLDDDFLRALAWHCRQVKPDFWLMGEVVHGDYRHWANEHTLDATTNYEGYDGLYSSHVNRSYYELAHALNRQFGEGGVYRDLLLYSFADNHDVNRIASSLTTASHLYPLHILLFTMPGVPSIYYGSEWGIAGARTETSDVMLRPSINLHHDPAGIDNRELFYTVQRMAGLRREIAALRDGAYYPLHVAAEQFVFARQNAAEIAIVAVNAANQPAVLTLEHLPPVLHDRLNGGYIEAVADQTEIKLHPNWGAVLTA